MALRHLHVFAFLIVLQQITAVHLMDQASRIRIDGLVRSVEQLTGRLARPAQPTDVQQLLPAHRPQQPWPYRGLDTATYSVQLTDTHALVASVSHAVLPGVTSDMLLWWFQNIEGQATYPGDGRVWSKYLMWHPRDHIFQSDVTGPPPPAAATTAHPSSPHPVLWEICEYIVCSHPQGYTASNYPGAQDTSHEHFVKTVAEVKQLDSKGLWVGIPSHTVPVVFRVLGNTFWNLKHNWIDTPEGVLVNSTQVVGVVEPSWRPMGYARLRNAVVRGLYGQGREPVQLLEQWLQHCVEEVGNLEHILPSLCAEAMRSQSSSSTGGSGSSSGGSPSSTEATPHTAADEL